MKRSSYLFELKQDAHLLIRDLQLTGMKKHLVYIELAKRLNIPLEECHFSLMKKPHQVISAIDALEAIWRDRKRRKTKRHSLKHSPTKVKRLKVMKRYKERKMLPQDEMQRLTAQVGKLNEKRTKQTILSKYLPFLVDFLQKFK